MAKGAGQATEAVTGSPLAGSVVQLAFPGIKKLFNYNAIRKALDPNSIAKTENELQNEVIRYQHNFNKKFGKQRVETSNMDKLIQKRIERELANNHKDKKNNVATLEVFKTPTRPGRPGESTYEWERSNGEKLPLGSVNGQGEPILPPSKENRLAIAHPGKRTEIVLPDYDEHGEYTLGIDKSSPYGTVYHSVEKPGAYIQPTAKTQTLSDLWRRRKEIDNQNSSQAVKNDLRKIIDKTIAAHSPEAAAFLQEQQVREELLKQTQANKKFLELAKKNSKKDNTQWLWATHPKAKLALKGIEYIKPYVEKHWSEIKAVSKALLKDKKAGLKYTTNLFTSIKNKDMPEFVKAVHKILEVK